ncbi:HAD-IB family hydrolase [Candidatus Sumerlaeota bacterium]|nr:HAD-IB family hydrolase [Candidatus Sumerlaeota bacterium]
MMTPSTPIPAPDCRVHIFDMDHTLIDNDCDLSWQTYLQADGRAEITNLFWRDFYYNMYRLGRLNVPAFLRFQYSEMIGRTKDELRSSFDAHYERYVRGAIYPEARALLAQLRGEGRITAICTASAAVLAENLQRELNVEHLLGTQLRTDGAGRYTGEIEEPYCYGPGKIEWVSRFCREHGFSLDDAAYYGDSATDIPVMEACGHAVAVNPAPQLERRARAQGWPIVHFERSGEAVQA